MLTQALLLALLVLMRGNSAGAVPDLAAQVPMRDGVRLKTLVYLPQNTSETGSATILLRTPYRFPGEAAAYYERFARVFTDRGYAFVLQDVRGRFGSGGTFRPFSGEIADGADTADWIAGQPWSDGRIGTVGGSYNGFTALAAAIGSDRVGAVVADDPAIDLFSGRRGGAVGLLPAMWLYLLDHGGWPDAALLEAASNTPSAEEIDNLLLGRDSAFWQEYLDRPSPPADRTLRGRLAEICAPVLVAKSRSEAWEDPVEVWRTLREEGCPRHRSAHRLIVTAEEHTHHMNLIGVSETPVNRRMVDWFDRWLRDGDAKVGAEEAPVLYRPVEDGPLVAAETWPVPGRERSLYLQNPWGLSSNAPLRDRPAARDRVDELEIDPAAISPCADYPRQTYLSEPLKSGITVAGNMWLEIFVSASTPSMEISALVYDYDRDRARDKRLEFVTFAVARVEPAAGDGPTRAIVRMPSVGHRFHEGSQIALAISGSPCGYVEAENGASRDDPPRASTYRIHHGKSHPSRLVLGDADAAK